MKYCSKCKRVYADGIKCECIREKRYDWGKPIVMVPLDCEPICECGSVEGLNYIPPYEYVSIARTDPSYCRCEECDRKLKARIAREETMKYFIIDSYRDENEFCENNDAVEEYLDEHYAHDWDGEPGELDVIILKLEPVEKKATKVRFQTYMGESQRRDGQIQRGAKYPYCNS